MCSRGQEVESLVLPLYEVVQKRNRQRVTASAIAVDQTVVAQQREHLTHVARRKPSLELLRCAYYVLHASLEFAKPAITCSKSRCRSVARYQRAAQKSESNFIRMSSTGILIFGFN